ncbi:uncharacterized protein K441DRAFT_596083, partial [Cenococcum geophilum 1.58]
IKKESAIKAYWRRMLCKFIDVVGYSINNGWIPTYLTLIYKLDILEKEKDAMYMQDLYAIINTH